VLPISQATIDGPVRIRATADFRSWVGQLETQCGQPLSSVMAGLQAGDPGQSDLDSVAIAHLKGARDYAAWLESIERGAGTSRAKLIRLTLAEYASRRNLPTPPEF